MRVPTFPHPLLPTLALALSVLALTACGGARAQSSSAAGTGGGVQRTMVTVAPPAASK